MKKVGLTWIELLVVIIIIFILSRILRPTQLGNDEIISRNRRSNCVSNLHQLGLAIHQYSMDFNDYFPSVGSNFDNPAQALGLLAKNYLSGTGEVFICFSDITPGLTPLHSWPDTLMPNDFKTRSDGSPNCSYAYKIGLTETSSSDTPLILDACGTGTTISWSRSGENQNHGPDGVNAMFVDGSTKWIPKGLPYGAEWAKQ